MDMDMDMDMDTQEILRYNTEQVQPCIAPLMIYPNKPDLHADELKCGGTCFFVRSGDQQFLVTAAHVYEEVERCGDEFLPLVLVVNGSPPVDISGWNLISKCTFIDIAVVEIPSDFDLSSIGKEAFTYNASQETRVAVNERVFYVGYPSEYRVTSKSKFVAGMMPFMDFVTSVNDRAFFMSDDALERGSFPFDHSVDQISTFGGLSGSPIVVVREGEFKLVGVFIEGGFQEEGIHSPFRGAHFDLINSDGSFDELRIPY